MSVPEFTCWTITTVKLELPDVDCHYLSKPFRCKVSRRDEDNARVEIKRSFGPMFFVVPWYEIVDALNRNERVRLDE